MTSHADPPPGTFGAPKSRPKEDSGWKGQFFLTLALRKSRSNEGRDSMNHQSLESCWEPEPQYRKSQRLERTVLRLAAGGARASKSSHFSTVRLHFYMAERKHNQFQGRTRTPSVREHIQPTVSAAQGCFPTAGGAAAKHTGLKYVVWFQNQGL